MILLGTLFSTAVWFSVNKLILSTFNKPVSLAARMYLVISTVMVLMTTILAVALAVAAIE